MRPLLPVFILFVILNGFFIAGRSLLESWGLDQSVLIIGNLVLFAATLLSYFISLRGLRTTSGHVAVRSVYGSFMVKFFLCVIAAFIYIMMKKNNVNKPALFTCMGLYIVYTFMEVSLLTKMSRTKKNA